MRVAQVRRVSGVWCALLLASALPAAAKVLDRIAAVVNHEVILMSDVDRRCQEELEAVPANLPVDQAVTKQREIRKRTLELVIDEALFRQQVQEAKIQVTDADVQQSIDQLMKDNNMNETQFAQALKLDGRTPDDLRREIRHQLERSKLLDVQMRNNPELRTKLQVSEKDVEEVYRTQYESSISSEKARASHILFLVPAAATPEQEQAIRLKATGILEQIRRGAAFAELAKQYSEDTTGAAGGDLGWFKRGEFMAAFEKAAFGLKKGELSELVRSEIGFHIILVTDKGSEGPPPLDKVDAEIRNRLMRDKFQKMMQEWMADLRRAAFIENKL